MKGIFLIFIQRVLNLPLELFPHLHETFFEGIEEEQKNEKITKFSYYLIITKVYFVDRKEDGKKKKLEINFFKPEEEIYYDEASFKYTFPIKSTYSDNVVSLQQSLKVMRLIMVINKSKIPEIIKKINSEFTEEKSMEENKFE
jgi:hypothetical protein